LAFPSRLAFRLSLHHLSSYFRLHPTPPRPSAPLSGPYTGPTGPPSEHVHWKSTHSVSGGHGGDGHSDGLSNRFEYSFGLNPAAPSGNPVVFLSTASGPQLTYTRRNRSLTGLNYSVWTSTNLTDWAEDLGAVEGAPSVLGDVETVPVTISPVLLSHPKLFIQVRAR